MAGGQQYRSGGARAAAAMVMAAALVALMAAPRGAQAASVLLQGYLLKAGARLVQGPYELRMQSDCNLVLYKNGNKVLWASHTYKKGTGCYFIMQNDGNAVIYTGAKKAVYSTNTYGRNDGTHYIIMQGDGNVVMYNGGGRAIWSTGTYGLAAPQQQLDGRDLLRNAQPGGVLAPADLAQP